MYMVTQPADGIRPPHIWVNRGPTADRLSAELRKLRPRPVWLRSAENRGASSVVRVIAQEVNDHYPGGQLFVDLRGSDLVTVLRESLIRLGVPTDLLTSTVKNLGRQFNDAASEDVRLIMVRSDRNTDSARLFRPSRDVCGFVLVSPDSANDMEFLELELPPFDAEQRAELFDQVGLDHRLRPTINDDELFGPHELLQIARLISNDPDLAGESQEELKNIVTLGSSNGVLQASLSDAALWLYRFLHLLPQRLFDETTAEILIGPQPQDPSPLDELIRLDLVIPDNHGYFRLHRSSAAEPHSTSLADRTQFRLSFESYFDKVLALAQEADRIIMGNRRRIMPQAPLEGLHGHSGKWEAEKWFFERHTALKTMVTIALHNQWWTRAVSLAEALWAFYNNQPFPEEAVDCYSDALVAAETIAFDDPAVELQARLWLGKSLSEIGGFDESLQHLREAELLCDMIGDKPYPRHMFQASVFEQQARTLAARGDLLEAEERTDQALELCPKFADEQRRIRSKALYTKQKGEILERMGRHQDAKGHYERSINLFRSIGEQNIEPKVAAKLALLQAEESANRPSLLRAHNALTKLSSKKDKAEGWERLAAYSRDKDFQLRCLKSALAVWESGHSPRANDVKHRIAALEQDIRA